MLSFRLALFSAVFLAFSAKSEAATIYSVYQGGASGTLEYQFSSDVPLTLANAPGLIGNGGTEFGEAPLNGSVQYFGDSVHHINAWSDAGNLGPALGGQVAAVGDTLFFKLIDSLTLKFASGSIPTTAGTYALVPGEGPPSGTGSPIDSYALRGASAGFPIAEELEFGIVTFVDTVVITQTGIGLAVPEPASMSLAIAGLVVCGLLKRIKA